MFFQFFRTRNWIRTTGQVLDSRIRKVYYTPSSMKSVGPIPLYSYIVEFSGPDGQKVRLEVKQPLGAMNVHVGSQVPLLVRPDAGKAILDEDDPQLNAVAFREATKRADKERFRRLLEGGDGGAGDGSRTSEAESAEATRLYEKGMPLVEIGRRMRNKRH